MNKVDNMNQSKQIHGTVLMKNPDMFDGEANIDGA